MTDVENRLTSLEQRCKSNGHRLEHLEKQQEAIHDLAASIKVMASEQKHQTETINLVRKDVTRLESKVDVLETKPAKRWDGLVDKAIWGVVGAVLAFLLSQIGIG